MFFFSDAFKILIITDIFYLLQDDRRQDHPGIEGDRYGAIKDGEMGKSPFTQSISNREDHLIYK